MRGVLAGAALLLLADGADLAFGAAARPASTPTPAPRLTGGFGRPRATPAAGAEAAQSSSKAGPVTITNDSLVTDPSKGRVTTGIARPAPAPARGVSPGTAAAPQATPLPSAEPAGGGEQPGSADEARWRETARRARERVAELEGRVAELEATSKRLESDFYSWDDGQYRDRVIKPAWDRAREELETARRDLAAARRDLDELPDRARRAGALPGWVRE
jgi:hypothetical protein